MFDAQEKLIELNHPPIQTLRHIIKKDCNE